MRASSPTSSAGRRSGRGATTSSRPCTRSGQVRGRRGAARRDARRAWRGRVVGRLVRTPCLHPLPPGRVHTRARERRARPRRPRRPPEPVDGRVRREPGTACHSWAALSLWFLGYPDQARDRVRRAVELSERPAHRHGRATAFAHAALVAQCRLDVDETLTTAGAAIEIGTEMGFAYRVAMGTILHGWARAAAGQFDEGIAQVRSGLELARAVGVRMDDSYFLGLLADACAPGEPRRAWPPSTRHSRTCRAGVVSSTSQSCTGSAERLLLRERAREEEKTRSGERSRLRRRRAAARSNSGRR